MAPALPGPADPSAGTPPGIGLFAAVTLAPVLPILLGAAVGGWWCWLAVLWIAGLMLGVKTIVSPEMGWEALLTAFAAAILGGIGSPAGAVLAGLVLGVAQEISTPFVGFTYKIALAFAVMLVVLLVRPRGLFGRLEGAR